MDLITLVGVGHVLDLREAIRAIVHRRAPKYVALELDATRYQALRTGPHGGRGPLTYRLLAHLQRSMAEDLGTPVGGEMLAAEAAAREVGASVALIDLDAGYVWRRLWSAMTPREKLRLLTGSLVGFVASRGRVEEELSRYEKDSGSYLDEFGRQFPSVKRVLLDERNDHMAEALQRLHAQGGDVLAVVGDGHVPGLQARLQDIPLDIIRLADLRKRPLGDTFSVGYELGRGTKT